MKTQLIFSLVTVSVAALFASPSSVREALDSVECNASQKALRTFCDGEIGGQRICRHLSYQALANLVSNDWQTVLSNIGTIATNQTERYLILGVGFQYGWDFHLPFFTRLADECLSGNVTTNEVSWFAAYSTKPGLVDQLYVRHSDPAVTNLLWKMIQVEGTNHWAEIMSDRALDLLEDAQTSGTLYIPE